MRSLIGSGSEQRYVWSWRPATPSSQSCNALPDEQRPPSSNFTAIGALSEVRLGFFGCVWGEMGGRRGV